MGSSPLARGLQAPHENARDHAGIIPARAGFTDMAVGISNLPTDHPRSRGVYTIPERYRRFMKGSSPLARGLPFRAVADGDPVRIIPARAGFTDARSGL